MRAKVWSVKYEAVTWKT